MATRAAGARHYVTHGEDGLLCGIDDAPDLARQIELLIGNRDLRHQLALNGRKTYESLFSKNVVVPTMIAAYQDMMTIGKYRRHYSGRLDFVDTNSLYRRLEAKSPEAAMPNEPELALRAAHVMAAYEMQNNDASLWLDAVSLERTGHYRFNKTRYFRKIVEIWTHREIDIAINNRTLLEDIRIAPGNI